MNPDEDIRDYQELAQKALEYCDHAGDNGPFEKNMLIAGIMNAAGSLLKSSGVLVPGAGLVVDLCRWVGERAKLVKEGQEAASTLNNDVRLALKNLKRRITILEDCECALTRLETDRVQFEDLEDAVNDFHDILPETCATLTRAGQISTMAATNGRGVKKILRHFFGAKTVSKAFLTSFHDSLTPVICSS